MSKVNQPFDLKFASCPSFMVDITIKVEMLYPKYYEHKEELLDVLNLKRDFFY